MTSETWRQTASPTSTILRTFDYDFDAVGRLTEVADSDSLAPDFGFVYDARGQLGKEKGAGAFLVDWASGRC